MSKNRYRLYIDESGDHTYGKIITSNSTSDFSYDKIKITYDKYPDLDQPQKRYLCLTGSIVESETYSTQLSFEMEELKKRHFTYDPYRPLVFHREDMVHKRYSFWVLKDDKKRESFDNDLLNFMKTMNYTIISVVIDKKAHIQQYRNNAFHPYHYCLTAMLERYCGFLFYHKSSGDVLAESRGRRDDEQLKEAYKEFYSVGTKYCSDDRRLSTLTSKEIKLKKSTENEAGLQLSDLLAHPLKHDILSANGHTPKKDDFSTRVLAAVESKFNRRYDTGRIDGYGKIFLKK